MKQSTRHYGWSKSKMAWEAAKQREKSKWGAVVVLTEIRIFRREGTHICLWLIHVDVWQRPSQYCKVIILQLI